MIAQNMLHVKRRTLVMACCWLAYTAVYLLRNNLPVALPYIEAEYHISRASLGLLSSVFLWVYGLGQLVNGYLGDRISARYFMLLGLFMACVMNMLFAFSHAYWVMVLCWACNGWFQSMLWGPISKTIANWYEPEKSGGAMIAISTSTAAGALLSMLISGSLAQSSGWRNVFMAPAIIGCAYLVIHLIVFKDKPQAGLVQSNASMETNKQALLPLKLILKRRDVQFVTIASFCQGIVRDGISLWAAMFFMEAYGLDIKHAVMFMLLIPVANFLGVILIGRLYKKYPFGLERLAAMTFMAGALMTGILFFLWHASAFVAMVLLALASAAMCAANTLLLGVYPLFFAKEGRVSGVAGFLEFSAYLAAGCTAVLSGLLLDLMGWQSVLVLWLAVALIGALALFMAKRVQGSAS